jgi:hypothetical protein
MLVLLCVWGGTARAQNCPVGIDTSAVCGLQGALNVQPTDSVWGFQFGQTPHTRQITINQIINTPGSALYVPFTGGSFTGGITVPAITVNGSVSGNPVFTGVVSFSGGVNLGTGPTILDPIFTLPGSPFTSLPGVTASNAGMEYFDTTCQNGAEAGGHGTGCLAHVNNAGVWVDTPYPPNFTVSIAGISMALVPGASVPAQGTGNLIQTSSGPQGIQGNIVVFGPGGQTIDSGVICCSPGVGGSGAVIAAGNAGQIPWYSQTGTAVSPLPVVNGGVLSWNGSGQPSISTTLPGSLTIPSPSISNPTLTGTTTVGVETHTGKATLFASSTGAASENMPPGVAPNSPVNGDRWATSTAFFGYINGAVGGFATTANGGPLTGSGAVAVSASGQISCATCVTSSSGGALAVSLPLTLSGQTIGLGKTTGVIPINFDADFPIHADTYYFPSSWGWAAGDMLTLEYWTGGTNTPSFVMSWQINGVNITNCSNITVSQATNPNRANRGTATCSLTNNEIVSGQPVQLVISNIVGNPASAYIGATYDHSNP